VRPAVERLLRHVYIRRLASVPTPVYTTDYVTPFVNSWRELFAPLQGRAGLELLEVGTYEGRSLAWFLDNVATHPSARVTVIDRFLGPFIQVRYEHNLAIRPDRDKVTTLYGNSSYLWWNLPDEHFDVIYVDGGHWAGQVVVDAVMAWRKLAPGGILLFDDYEWRPDLATPDRPAAAIDAVLGLVAGEFTVLSRDYQLAIRKNGAR
jgi:predicted O-methyltransferase YrrM